MTPAWSLRQSVPADAGWMVELRAEVMRPDLMRLGRYDPVRVRQRFLDAFSPSHTSVIQVGKEDVGLIAVRPDDDGVWIEHFYLDGERHGLGIGSQVLTWALERDTDGLPFRLNVLQGSPARRLYERHGFVLEHEDPVDVILMRLAASSAP